MSSAVSPDATPYTQRIAGLDLAIEKGTERTPDKHRYHVILNGELVATFRSLPQAQAEFKRLRDESGWKPPERAVDPAEVRRRQQQERWSRNRAG